MIPLKNGQKEHSWILFWNHAKTCTCRYYGNKQKAEGKNPPTAKKPTPTQVWKQLAMYDYFYDHKPLAATNLLSISDLIEGNRCQRDQKYTRPPFSY